MDITQQIDTSYLFHAYIIEGDASVVPLIETHLENSLSFSLRGNPDFFKKEYDTLKVDDSRTIIDFAQTKSFGERKIILLFASFLTDAAQDALLKLLEEPPAQTFFFIITPGAGALRPTLLSRVRFVRTKAEQKPESSFLADDYPTRLATIAKLAKDKDKGRARVLLDEVEEALYYMHGVRESTYKDALKNIAQARQYLAQSGAPLKMLLESVAVSLPIIKT